jgi:SUF system NifU family Fe-S assembly protein
MAGLEDLYREIILDHYRAPRNRGELPVPPAHKVEGFNPLCGDEVVLYLELDGDTVTDVRTGGQGCSISQASTSMMSGRCRCLAAAPATLITLRSLHDTFSTSGLSRRPAHWPGAGRIGSACLVGVKRHPEGFLHATG